MPWIVWLKMALTTAALLLWTLSLAMTPFGEAIEDEEVPGIYLLILVCTIGLIYPEVVAFGLLNYGFLFLVCYNLAGRRSRPIGIAFLTFFTARLLSVLIGRYVFLEDHTGPFRAGAFVWMLALVIVGIATMVGEQVAGLGHESSAAPRAQFDSGRSVTSRAASPPLDGEAPGVSPE